MILEAGLKEIRQWEWLLRKFWQISVVRSAALEAVGEAAFTWAVPTAGTVSREWVHRTLAAYRMSTGGPQLAPF